MHHIYNLVVRPARTVFHTVSTGTLSNFTGVVKAARSDLFILFLKVVI